MSNVTANPEIAGGVYVIEREQSYGTLGFDVTLDRLERYALDLYRDPKPVDALMARMRPLRGQVAVYEQMRKLEVALVERAQETGERSAAELSPQLIGLEGWRVEVERIGGSRDGETARFIVGRSTGPIPCHLELKQSNSSGGDPADKEYKRVRSLERVR